MVSAFTIVNKVISRVLNGEKDKVISQFKATKEAHRNSIQHDFDHKITAFQSKIREGP